jgi:hypothetical protein
MSQIFELLPKIIGEISAVGKDHKNQLQGYKFRSVDDVYNVVNPLLGKYNVCVLPKYQIIKDEVGVNHKGTQQKTVILKGEYNFYAPDGSNLQVVTFGEAMDTSDKAYNKAMSTAYKYALFQTFCIPTEEEKDTEFQSLPLPYEEKKVVEISKKAETTSDIISEAQVKRLHAIANSNKEKAKEILEKYGYKSSKDIKKADYDKICKEIEGVK